MPDIALANTIGQTITMFTPLKPEVYQRLEQAVLDIFSHSDFHKANIRDVANRAGVSFSTIYKHYGSKERLVFAFVDAGAAATVCTGAAGASCSCRRPRRG